MSVSGVRITGVKAGETVLTEEQILTGYEVNLNFLGDFRRMEMATGTAADAMSGALFGASTHCHYWIFIAENNGLIFDWYSLDGLWVVDLVIPADQMAGFPLKANNVRVKNRTAGKNGVYTVMRFR